MISSTKTANALAPWRFPPSRDGHGSAYLVEFDGQDFDLHLKPNGAKTTVSWGEGAVDVICVNTENTVAIMGGAKTHLFEIIDPLDIARFEAEDGDHIHAPMPGLVKSVKVKSGDKVSEGDVLVVVEAMKMEHSLVAPREAVIESIDADEGEQVIDGALLISLVPDQEPEPAQERAE